MSAFVFPDMSLGNQVTPLIESNSGLEVSGDSQDLRNVANKLSLNETERYVFLLLSMGRFKMYTSVFILYKNLNGQYAYIWFEHRTA